MFHYIICIAALVGNGSLSNTWTDEYKIMYVFVCKRGREDGKQDNDWKICNLKTFPTAGIWLYGEVRADFNWYYFPT